MISILSEHVRRVSRMILRRSAPSSPAEGEAGLAGATTTGALASESYWTRHNVTGHRVFSSVAESLAYVDWRNDQYVGYIDLMPVTGWGDAVILDFGCGPGNDLVGFGTLSKPAKLIGMDVSTTSLTEAESRLQLHGIRAELVKIDERDDR